jgi:hypothetical protein
MKKNAIIFISLIVVFGFLTSPAPASWPPVQDITWNYELQSTKGSLWYSVPSSFPKNRGSWGCPWQYGLGTVGTIIDVKVADGIIAWVAYLEEGFMGYDTFVKFSVQYRVYDPVKGKWVGGGMEFEESFDVRQPRSLGQLTVKDGIVAWVTVHNAWHPHHWFRVERVHCATYDPAKEAWVVHKSTIMLTDFDVWGVQGLTIKDGIVAWVWGGKPSEFNFDWWDPTNWYYIFKIAWEVVTSLTGDPMSAFDLAGDAVKLWDRNIDQGDLTKHVHYAIYDPKRGMWNEADYYQQDWAFQSFWIDNATVYIKVWKPPFGSVVTNHRGYRVPDGRWDFDLVTRPEAHFVARPASGRAPLGVWFWDMSIGPRNLDRKYEIFDQTTTTRSPRFNFSYAGQWWGTQKIEFWDPDWLWDDTVSYNMSFNVNENVPPVGGITINNGAVATTSPTVTLQLSASDNIAVAQMQLGNRVGDSVDWRPWEPYRTSLTWSLTPGDGVKNVWVRYRDAAGNMSQGAWAGIKLDTTPPEASIKINAGAAGTNTRNATLTLRASDATSRVTKVRISEAYSLSCMHVTPWESFGPSTPGGSAVTETRSWVLVCEEGTKTVNAQFMDEAGNIISVSDTIVFNSAVAEDPGININGKTGLNVKGPNYTNNPQVNLNLYAPLTYQYQMALGKKPPGASQVTWGAWEIFSAVKTSELGKNKEGSWTEGAHEVWVQFKGRGGNISSAVKAQIILDRTPPIFSSIGSLLMRAVSAVKTVAAGGGDGYFVSVGGVSAVGGTTAVNINFQRYSDALVGIKCFVVYYSPFGLPDRNTGTKVYEGRKETFSHKGLEPGKTYYYRVYVVDQAGNWSSGDAFQIKTRNIPKPAMPWLMLLLD